MKPVRPAAHQAAPLHPQDFQHEYVQAGDLKMHVVVEGPAGAPLVVLLHGFPEFWYSWRHQIRALAAAGYRVAAPDQRGYNLTEQKGPYNVFTLTRDIANLVRALGYDRAVIVGHDWGGAIAWLLGAFHPDLVERLIVCNCPHPVTLIRAVRGLYLPQIARSWYIGLFQVPILPELILGARNYEPLAALLRAALPGGISEEEIGYYREAWARPGALSAAINWYRELTRSIGPLAIRDTTVRLPVRLIWGEPDVALDTRVAKWSRELCPGLDLRFIQNAGHFVQQDVPAEVNELILDFLV
jgi:pimeloyl-ACP methyl ester carboxylesterase